MTPTDMNNVFALRSPARAAATPTPDPRNGAGRVGDIDKRMWLPANVPDKPGKPTDTEITQAGLYARGYITVSQLVFICETQIRAGLALDAWLRRNRGEL